MISNERQYRITRARLKDFESALSEVAATGTSATVSSELLALQQEALSSQREELAAEIDEYERLRSGEQTIIEASSLAEFPRALIAGRVVRGLTQKQLGEKIGVKEQQIQRWESTGYANTTFGRIREVVAAMGLHVREEVFIPSSGFTAKKLIENLKKVGLRSDALIKRVLPAEIFSQLYQDSGSEEQAGVLFQAAGVIARVFGLSVADLFSERVPQLDLQALAVGRYKIPATAGEDAVSAYTLYAHYLAALTAQCVNHIALLPLPSSWQEVHAGITGGSDETISFDAALDYVWGLGIPVLPLQDPGTFHGAVWVIKARPIIVLKQGSRLVAKWLFDLLHELAHVVQRVRAGQLTSPFEIIEVHPITPERRGAPEEEEANDLAEDVLFHGRSEEVEKACVNAAKGDIRNLKRIVPGVARREHIEVGVLANHMAFRLSQQDETWWSTAMTMQAGGKDPFAAARGRLLTDIRLNVLSEVDANLLLRAFSDPSPEGGNR
ncbi:MAG: helix-turn-helix transcriptional regulator [Chthoniobacterales bacterium]|nr:helix-turn-helix transcriptional regulator [Chthoniobacterales bacterium]